MRPIDRIWPLLAGLVMGGLWWAFGTVEKLPALEAHVPPGLFDFLAYYRPNAHYAFSRMAAGDLPLWNPQQGFGMPFLATLQTGVLYPPNWLHLILPVQLAYAVLAAFHLGLAAALASALAGALGASGWGAVAAGLLFGGSSWLLGALWSPPTLYSAAWLPGVLLAIDRIIERPDPRRAAALAAVVAMQALTGWPYVLLMTALAAGLFAAGSLIEVTLREQRVPVARALALAAGAVGGILLAAPQLLPAAELVSHSSRALGVLDENQTVLLTSQHDPGQFLSPSSAPARATAFRERSRSPSPCSPSAGAARGVRASRSFSRSASSGSSSRSRCTLPSTGGCASCRWRETSGFRSATGCCPPSPSPLQQAWE